MLRSLSKTETLQRHSHTTVHFVSRDDVSECDRTLPDRHPGIWFATQCFLSVTNTTDCLPLRGIVHAQYSASHEARIRSRSLCMRVQPVCSCKVPPLKTQLDSVSEGCLRCLYSVDIVSHVGTSKIQCSTLFHLQLPPLASSSPSHCVR